MKNKFRILSGIMTLLAFSRVTNANVFCFQSDNGKTGSLKIDKKIVAFNYDLKSNLAMNKMSGWTQSFSESRGSVVAKSYLDSAASDGFSATIIVDSKFIVLKEGVRTLATYNITQCPTRGY